MLPPARHRDVTAPSRAGTPSRGSRPHSALEANAEELVGAAVEAAKKGEWRALMALMDRVRGKPSEHIELKAETPQTVEAIWRMNPDFAAVVCSSLGGHPA